MSRSISPRTLIGAALAGAFLAAPAAAQDVTYRTESSFALDGALGSVVRLAARLGGAPTNYVETTYLKGKRMRVDSEGSSTILDLEGGRMIFLDHENRTFTRFTFEDMAEAMHALGAQAEAAQAASRQEQPAAEGDVEWEFRMSVDRPGERRDVGGYAAERVFLTMEMEGHARGEEMEPEDGGRIVVLNDMWLSKDVPAYTAMQGLGEAYVGEMRAGSAGSIEGLQGAFAQDPRTRAALEEARREAEKLDGMSVESTTYIVTVAPGAEFDREAVLNPAKADEPSAGQRAVRGILGGRLGRAEAQPEEPQEAPAQGTLMRFTSRLTDVSTDPVPASLFEVPEGYSQVEPTTGG